MPCLPNHTEHKGKGKTWVLPLLLAQRKSLHVQYDSQESGVFPENRWIYKPHKPPEDGDRSRLWTVPEAGDNFYPSHVCGTLSLVSRGTVCCLPAFHAWTSQPALCLLSTSLLQEGLSWPRAALPLKGDFLGPHLRNPKPELEAGVQALGNSALSLKVTAL